MRPHRLTSVLAGRLGPLAGRLGRVPDRLRRILGRPTLWDLPDDEFVRTAYHVFLRREPDDGGASHFLAALASGELSRHDVLDHLRWSPEFHRAAPARGDQLGHALHLSRCQFIASLPPARTILDLGGSSSYSEWGAMVAMGYPYCFDSLTIVDLPPADRHELYRWESNPTAVDSPNGPVHYAYHSMTDLSAYEDETFDLVYCGQTIEHVHEAEGDHVLREIRRVLRPGGHLGLDTPNARATRAQQAEFIDPDHKVEYTHSEIVAKLEGAGLQVVEAKGLNYLGRALAGGEFSVEEATVNTGMFAAPEDCYLLAYVCRRNG